MALYPLGDNETVKPLSNATIHIESALSQKRDVASGVTLYVPSGYQHVTTNQLVNDGTVINEGEIYVDGEPSGGSGTVTSVALSAPSPFSVSGSPVTSTGTLALSLPGGTTGTGALVLGTTPTFAGIADTGAVAAGTWNGTKIGLAYGGTNADLSATGGTSQVLKQTTLGGAVTVGPLAGSDISTTAGVKAETQTNLAAGLRQLDAIPQLTVKSATTTTPPASPADGDCYIIPAGATGVWSGQTNKVARYSTVTGGYEFYSPVKGWQASVDDTYPTIARYDGSTWGNYYQEGTWTPTIAGSTTAGTNTYSQQVGLYTKTGRIYNCEFAITVTAKDAAMAGNALVSGFPASSNATTGYRSAVTLGFVTQIDLATGYTQHTGYIPESVTSVNLAQAGDLINGGITTAANIQNTTRIFGRLSYST